MNAAFEGPGAAKVDELHLDPGVPGMYMRAIFDQIHGIARICAGPAKWILMVCAAPENEQAIHIHLPGPAQKAAEPLDMVN